MFTLSSLLHRRIAFEGRLCILIDMLSLRVLVGVALVTGICVPRACLGSHYSVTVVDDMPAGKKHQREKENHRKGHA